MASAGKYRKISREPVTTPSPRRLSWFWPFAQRRTGSCPVELSSCCRDTAPDQRWSKMWVQSVVFEIPNLIQKILFFCTTGLRLLDLLSEPRILSPSPNLSNFLMTPDLGFFF